MPVEITTFSSTKKIFKGKKQKEQEKGNKLPILLRFDIQALLSFFKRNNIFLVIDTPLSRWAGVRCTTIRKIWGGIP